MDALPPVGLGTMGLSGVDGIETVETALDCGYRHLDTASVYGNEAEVGAAIRRSDVPREDVTLATKVWTDRLGFDALQSAARERAATLGVETIDLLYIHRPRETYGPAATMAALDQLREYGVIRGVGVSNFTVEQVAAATDHLDAPLVANQVECHPLHPATEQLDHALDNDYQLVAYSPLATGVVADVPALASVAEEIDTTPAQVALAWLRERGAVAIPKASSEAHLRENLAAADLDLGATTRDRIDGIERSQQFFE
jgi:2,5-diketo-D-gluconate reductase B